MTTGYGPSSRQKGRKENYSNKVKELHKLTAFLSYYNRRFKAFSHPKI